jgi:hypothetical protein
MTDQSFTFDRASQRYRDLATGRWMPERDVRDAVDRVADLASRRMGEAAARFRAGEITADTWLTEHLALVKQSQIAAALAANGGRQQMDAQTWGRVGAEIKRQYQYSRQMVADVLNGRQRMNGRLDARARMYGQAARATYENTRRRQSAESGLSFEQNHLHASESCDQCRSMSAMGRVPVGTLVPIGQRTCRSSCRCTLSYSRTMSEAA